MERGKHAIEIENLRFQWRQGVPVLDLPRLCIGRGESVFIKGASGSGKSTLLSLLGGVLLPQAGTVSVLGQRLDELGSTRRDAFRAEHIGFIFQMFNLIPYLSVLENVLLPCRFSSRRRQRIAQQGLQPEDEAVRLLEHLDLPAMLLHRSVTELSVGQQQRVAAARALIGSPELVIADEPTSALDADRCGSFLRLLLKESASRDSTVVFVSHDARLEGYFSRSVDLTGINRAALEG
ncbi:MAG: ABC transporter ATP-binding protein [Sedimenticola sp.]|nr:ABC transporter ATP-binding protein [Sedimenticola sp.]